MDVAMRRKTEEMALVLSEAPPVTTYIYMNHHIRSRNPKGPVINVQEGRRVQSCNRVEITGPSSVVFDPKGLRACKTHHVTAWIETNYGVDLK